MKNHLLDECTLDPSADIAECGTRSGHRHLAAGVCALHTTLRRLIDIATVVANAAARLDDPARDRRHAEETHDTNKEEDDVVPVAGVGDVARILQFGDGGVRPAAKFAGYLRP